MAAKQPASSGKEWTRSEVAQLKKELKSNTPTRGGVAPAADTWRRPAEGEQPRSVHEADEQEPVRDGREAPRSVGPWADCGLNCRVGPSMRRP
jgi:hypothetical protein